MAIVISFENVSKNYNEQFVLSNVSFQLKKGEMAFLTGHSGMGKTTLLKLIMLIEKVSGGQIFVNGRNLQRLALHQIPYLRREIGMIFQNPQLMPNNNVFENVSLPLVIRKFRHQEIKRRVRAALDKVGLLHKEKSYPLALSVGEQQRVGIARAIVNKPPLVLADEPTGNLDPDLSKEIIRLFAAFNAVGSTVLIATHDLSMIASLNYRVMTLKNGQLFNHEEL